MVKTSDLKKIKDLESNDDECLAAEKRISKIAHDFGIPCIFGDLLTFERFRTGKRIRKGSVTILERFDLLRFDLSIFHLKMNRTILEFQGPRP